MTRAALVIGCVLAGLAAGGIWTLLQADRYRNLLIGGLAGLLLGLVLVGAQTRRREPALPAVDPAVEERVQARIDQVARRERSLAQHARQLAAREHDLERREAELEEAATAPVPEPEPNPEPEPEPEPEVEPEESPASLAGGWTLEALEALTQERTDAGASAAQQEEWSTYLFLLREHAHADGTLPKSFEGLVNDVFGPLPQRDA